MNVEAILKNKGRDVVTIAPEATINDAVLLLRRKRIGALVIGGATGPEGILSERDIVRALADYGARIFDLPVSALMTRRVITCTPKDSVAGLMAEMTERRIRHLPVVEDGVLIGIVSIGDVVKHHLGEVEHEANALRQFIASA
ncbi:MAG TPA: CBS domain-containing protein [Stellaceae bacterium]|jgi:CBS domain-containing protein|nr:CBS domain-containing protein [Stellaceae bacterium]